MNSLYAVYEDAHQGFAERYLDLLRAGGTCGTRSCWRRSASTPPTPPSGRRGSRSSPALSTSSKRSSDPSIVTDDNSFTGRVRRYAQVVDRDGRACGAARRRALSRPAASTAAGTPPSCKAALGGIKGPLMKVAQLLATIPDALPREYVERAGAAAGECAGDGLAVRAPPHGGRARRPTGRAGFASFEQERGARRLARARCTGRPRSTARALACKLQYPDMASAVEADLRQLKLAIGLYERYDRAVTTAEIHAEIADAAARGARLRARGRAYAALRRDPARRARRRRAGAVARAVDPAPADHDLARRRAAPRYRRGAARAAQPGRAATCSAPGTCRSTTTA